VTTATTLLLIVACLVLSAFFSAAETALLRLRPEELEGDIKQAKNPSAVAARNLLRNTSRLLVTILLGNNVVNILSASVASALAVQYLGSEAGVYVSAFVITVLVLIFGEILPKSIAAGHAKKVSYIVALPLYLIHHSLFLVHAVFDRLIDPLMRRLSGGDTETRDSAQEILRLARGFRQHRWDGSPISIIAGAAGAADLTVSDIMVPRTEILAFPADIEAETLLDKMIEEAHTRVPIYNGSLDKVQGLIHIKDLFRMVRSGEKDIQEIMKPILRVPERKPILRLLTDMQRAFTHMAIVKDEFGVTLGIVTQEDILEEIVGEIRDEFDKEELETIQKVGEDTYEVLGRISVHDFNRHTGWTITAERGDTMSGLIFNQLGRSPKKGDEVRTGDYVISVVGLSGHRITRVRAKRAEPPAA
jgi:putative hemolysin